MTYNLHVDQDRTASLDIDCQKGFTPLCPDELPIPQGDTIVAALNVQAQHGKYRIASKDWHPPTARWIASKSNPQLSPLKGYPELDLYWNAHCIAGTTGAEFLDGLPRPEDYDLVVYKGLEPHMHPYGACYHDLREKRSTGLIEFLRANDIDTVILGGLALDYCVATTAYQLVKNRFTVYVNLSATKALGSSGAAIQKLESNGIKLCELGVTNG